MPLPLQGTPQQRVPPILASGIVHRVQRLTHLLIRHPGRSLGAIAALTVLAAAFAAGTPVDGSTEALFPDDAPTVVRAREVRRLLGARAELRVLVGSADSDLNHRVAEELGRELSAVTALVDHVEVRRDISFFEQNALLYLTVEDVEELDEEVGLAIGQAVAAASGDDDEDWSVDDPADAPASSTSSESRHDSAAAPEHHGLPTLEEIRERYDGDWLTEFFESPDGTAVAVKVHPSFPPSDIDRSRQLIAAADAAVARVFAAHPETDLTHAFEGDYAHVSEALGQVNADMWASLGVAFGGIGIILVVYFRRVRDLPVLLPCLAVGVVWTGCSTRAVVGELNMMTVLTFSVVAGLGIDFLVHGASRVNEAWRAGVALDRAISIGLKNVGGATVMAALTTAATFAALSIFEFRALSHFGVIGALGVGVCFLVLFVVYPPLTLMLARMLPEPRQEGAVLEQAPDPAHTRASSPAARQRLGLGLLGGVLAAAIAAGFAIPTLEIETELRKMEPPRPHDPSVLRQRFARSKGVEHTGPAVFTTGSLEETLQLHQKLESLVPHEDALSGVQSIFSLVPDEQEEKQRLVTEIRRKLRNKRDAFDRENRERADALFEHLSPTSFSVASLPAWVKEKFTDTDGWLGRYVLMYVTGSRSDADNIEHIQDTVGTIRIGDRNYVSTASWMVLADAYRMVRKEGPVAVALACAVVLVLLSLGFRDWRQVVAAFVPLLIGFASFLGILAVAGIKLSMFNILVLPVVFGIGVDTAIHLLFRLNEGESLSGTLRTTGVAAAASAATTAVGFAGFLVMSSEGMRGIGWVACIGIVCCYLSCVATISGLVLVGFLDPADR